MNLSDLIKIKKREQKRVGRGIGSGKGGHTSGRGQKGQKSRSGGKSKWPRNYGQTRGFTRPGVGDRPAVVNVSFLNGFPDGTEITAETLLKAKLLRKTSRGGVKILGRGELKRRVNLHGLLVSATAREKVEKLGGSVSA